MASNVAFSLIVIIITYKNSNKYNNNNENNNNNKNNNKNPLLTMRSTNCTVQRANQMTRAHNSRA